MVKAIDFYIYLMDIDIDIYIDKSHLESNII